jgi:2,3-dihydroxybenzoate-AMP ligase
MLSGCVPWPEELASRYRQAGYWRGQTLGELLRDCASSYGERPALVGAERSWSYAAIDERVDRLAAGLLERGIGRQDRVVVQLPNLPELVILCFALFRIGALPVMALPAHRRSEISYLCSFCEAVAYVAPDRYQGFDYCKLASEVRDCSPTLEHVFIVGAPGDFVRLDELEGDPAATQPCDPGDVAFFLLSGGTTGLPKLIPRTHDDYIYNMRVSAEVAGLDQTSVYLAALPATHNFALGCPGIFGTLQAGGRVVLALNGSPDEVLPLIERERVTVTAAVPPLALMWMEAAARGEHDISSLRLLQVGGAKLSPEIARRLQPMLGCKLQQSFGMAEGLLSQTRSDDPEGIRIICQGRPISPADEVRIVDQAGRDVRSGQLGQLLVRGPYTIRGYYRASDYNATAFTEDGFLRTGDIVEATPMGNLIVEGRTLDFINRGGDKIAASEVEDHLLAHPAIREAALVALADDVMGEHTCACVVARGSAPTLRELKKFLRDRGLAEYKLPDRMQVFSTLPYTGVGKVSKAELRKVVAETFLTRDGE